MCSRADAGKDARDRPRMELETSVAPRDLATNEMEKPELDRRA